MKHYFKRMLALVGAALLLGCGVAGAQEVRFGIAGGANVTIVHHADGSTPRPGAQITGISNISLGNSNWSFEPRLSLELNMFRTQAYNDGEIIFLGGNDPVNSQFKMLSLHLPAMIGYNCSLGSNTVLQVKCGPGVRYIPKGWVKYGKARQWDGLSSGYYHRWIADVNATVGLEFNNHHRLEASYSCSLSRIDRDINSRFQVISLGYAYMF